ncbi:MAG: hypothetical protein MJK12_16945 [Colwellia sp.]|nr:hypothetical protein [Colwellia sp.]
MTVLKFLFLIVLASTLYFVLNMDDDKAVFEVDNLIENHSVEVSEKISDNRLPDYDPRKRVKNTVAIVQNNVTQYDSNYIDEVIQNSEHELQVIQKKYSQVFNDPNAKKELEEQAKMIGIEYKKALLVKLRNGEL